LSANLRGFSLKLACSFTLGKILSEDDRDRIIATLEEQLAHYKNLVRWAKDLSPVVKPSFARVKRMADEACLELTKEGKHFVISMGNKCRRVFRKLRDIWEFLSQDDWALSDLFPQLDPQKAAKPKGKPCQFCQGLIFWLPNKWGKWLPHNLEGGDRHRCEKLPQNKYEFAMPFT